MAKKKTVTKTKTGTTTYNQPSKSSEGSSYTAGGSGGSAGTGLTGAPGSREAELIKTLNTTLDPARHFVIVATPPKYSEYVASTSVYCPFRTHRGTLGGYWTENGTNPMGAIGVPAKNLATQEAFTGALQCLQGFTEVMGVVPEAIILDQIGASPVEYTGPDVFTYVKSIEYDYRPYGHKVITIHYNDNAGEDFQTYMHYVRLVVLFSDGSSETVTQPIASKLVTDNMSMKDYTGPGLGESVFENVRPPQGESHPFGDLLPHNQTNTRSFGLSFEMTGPGTNNSYFTAANARINGAFKSQQGYQATESNLPGGDLFWFAAGGSKNGTMQEADQRYGGVYALTTGNQYQSHPLLEESVQTMGGQFTWCDRYSVKKDNSFAAVIGGQSFYRHPSRIEIGTSITNGSLYDVTNGEWDGSVRPGNWRTRELHVGWNNSYTGGDFDSTPYNQFHPVHQFYNAESRNTFRHEGAAFGIHISGTDIPGTDTYEAETASLLASMSAYLKGNNSGTPTGGISPTYDTYVDPAGATFKSFMQSRAGATPDTKYFTGVGGDMDSNQAYYIANSAPWGYMRDILAAVILPQGNFTSQGFRVNHSTAFSGISLCNLFHTAIFGRKKKGPSFAPAFSAPGVNQEVFIYDDVAGSINSGVPGLRFPSFNSTQTGASDLFDSFFFDSYNGVFIESDGFTLTAFQDNFDITIYALPFYVHIDFPVEDSSVSGAGSSYANMQGGSAVSGSSTTVENTAVYFGEPETTQGGLDWLYCQSIKGVDGTVLTGLPVMTNNTIPTNSLGFSGSNTTQSLQDINSTYYVDNSIYPLGAGKAAAPYNAVTRQPWTKLNRDVSNERLLKYGYFYGGLLYNMGGEANKITTEIFLDNSRTPGTGYAPEIVFTRNRFVGTNNIFGRLEDNFYIQGSTYNSGSTVTPVGGILASGEIDTKRVQFQTVVDADGTAPSSATWKDPGVSTIYNGATQYRPGRNDEDSALFPINNSDRTLDGTVAFNPDGTQVVPDNDGGYNADREFSIQQTILAYTNGPGEPDTGHTDVDISDISGSWSYLDDTDFVLRNRVSKVSLRSDRIDHICHFSDLFTGLTAGQLTNLGGGGGADDTGNKYTEQYLFVVPGDYDAVVDPGDDGEEEIVYGCTDVNAVNFNSDATDDDGSCLQCADSASVDVTNNAFEMFSEAVTSASIGTLPEITLGGGEFGLDNITIQNGGYLDGYWVAGNIGNVMNYFPATQGIAYPDNTAAAAPWSYMTASFTINPANFANHPDLTNVNVDAFVTYYGDTAQPNEFRLRIYNIEDWNGEGKWASDGSITGAANIQDGKNFTNLDEILVNGESTTPVIVLDNLGSTIDLEFGYQLEANVGDNNYNVEPGKHYIAVLEYSPKDCVPSVFIAYNFWVAYCDCDLPAGENFGGANFTYPWSASNSFPGVYSNSEETLRVCANNPLTANRGFKRIGNRADTISGLCIIPDPYVDCNNIIDFCITETTFDCTLIGEVGENPTPAGVGTINVTIFGILTGSDIDEYNLLVDGQWLYFNVSLYQVTGETTDALISSIVIDSPEDYAAYGISAANSGAITLTFSNLAQATYYIQLTQLGSPFPFQDPELGLCGPLTPTDGTGNFSLGNGQDCPEFVQGCTDPTASNYNAEATVQFNGVSIDQSELCEYEDCSDVFSIVRPTSIAVTNTLAECVIDNTDPDNPIYYPGDTGTGAATISVSNTDSVYFNIGIVQLVNGNVSTGLDALVTFYGENAAEITDITDTSTNHTFGPGDGTISGGFLPPSNSTTTVDIPADFFGGSGLYAGNFLVVAVPISVTTVDNPDFNPLQDCTTQIFEFINNFSTFQVLLDTSQLVDCSEPCNDTIPGLCDDYVVGCTDPDAQNYNELANFDDGSCEYGEVTTEDCNNFPDSLECEECENLTTGERGGLRICDEFFGTDEGCCDPTACNFNPLANPCMQSRCEYECCDPTEDCGNVEDTEDECEDEYGNIVPDCDPPECPDPTNPNCDTPVVNPCPAGEPCPPPPNPPCIQLGTCPDEGPGEEDDPTVIIDEVVTEVISCDPMFNGVEFAQWQIAAMFCSGEEGSKMYFKLRSGVKYNDTDMIKLTLINYLFNQGIDLPCLYSCDLETDTLKRGNRVKDCKENWKKSIQETWAKTSTYRKGDIVRVLKNVRGKTRATYFTAKTDVPAGNRPDVRMQDNSYWALCKTVKAQEPIAGTENYLRVFYEFMLAMCHSCNIDQQAARAAAGRNTMKSRITSVNTRYTDDTNKSTRTNYGPSRGIQTGLIDDDGNEIIY